jgi:hypothetical protein
MPTDLAIQNAYASQLRQTSGVVDGKPRTYLYWGGEHIDPKDTLHAHLNMPVSLLTRKKIPGGDPVVNAPLWMALIPNHECDMHYVMYSSVREVRCIKADANTDLTFPIAAYDFDYEGHTERPSQADFTDFIRLCSLVDDLPNLVYPTRGGARIIFIIDPIHDPNVFESYFQSLLARLTEWKSPYVVDTAAKDWTRLYRSPSIIREDEDTKTKTTLWNNPVHLFHDRVYDLQKLSPKIKPPRPKITGNQKFAQVDHYIACGLSQAVEGNRNRSLFGLACHAIRKYNAAGAEKWIDHLRSQFSEMGLDDCEIEATIRSAHQTVVKEGN